ncbi:MAG: neutral/alkaline non-lysosomal ceramidase N-terminal domain-containing protein [Oscillospiraceae bacterium]|nr:neutral/alkaline non-lysosomal ceramidase N-terminal domain-containing protein [Oscillospiraceae bacterium]
MKQMNLKVGFGRKDLTPEYSVPLAGYGRTTDRMSQGWYTRLYATCIAITDEQDKTVLIYTVDVIRSIQSWTDEVRRKVTEATGVPGEAIMISAVHTHSAPDIGAAIKEDHPFYEQYIRTLTEAAMDAMADRTPTKAAAMGRKEIHGMNFVRHYITVDGEVIGDNFGDPTGKVFAGHTMPNDPQMQLLRLIREGKPDVLLVNWQGHPTVGSTGATDAGSVLRPFIGADYVAPFRDHIEKNSGCMVAFFQGASGNLNSRSRILEETATENVFTFGKQLAEHAMEALPALEDAYVGSLQTRRFIYEGKWDHSEDHMVEQAKQIRELWMRTGDHVLCREEGKKYGIHSGYHAGFILNRAAAGENYEMELNAIGLGDFSFVTAPYEMFCNNAQTVKEETPFSMTFVLTSANSGAGYIASEAAFDHGCYEVDNRKFGRGTAEKAVEHFLEMLQDMKA